MRFLIFSNIYIALAAVLLTGETYFLLGTAPQSLGLAVLVFCATLFVYNLDRLVSSSREDNFAITERHRWIEARRSWLWALALLSGAGGAASVFFVPFDLLLGLIPLGVVSLAYSLPFWKRDGKMLRLKDVPGIKIFLIALVWASVTVILPVLDAEVDPLGRHAVLTFVERLVFIFAITLPFDVRDLERDRKAGIRTLPMALGPSGTRWLAVGLMVAFTGLSVLNYGWQLDAASLPMALSGLLTAAALWGSDEVRGELYYVGVLDGTMILQWALVVAWAELVT